MPSRLDVLLLVILCGFASWLALDHLAQADADNKEQIPAWVQEVVPNQYRPFLGKAGLSETWRNRPGPLGSSVAGLDRWQANHFLVYRPETAKFLYDGYTPLKVEYRPGMLPSFEKVVAKFTADLKSDRAKALALLTRAMPEVCRHPTIPPCSPGVRADRNLLDEDLLRSGAGWCNEQARVFVRLCQVAGIPARMVFLFYANERSGHVVAEFFADGQWAMADTSWLCVFPAGQGTRLLSAAEAHEPAGREKTELAYRLRFQELLKLTDAELASRNPARLRKTLEAQVLTNDQLGSFGLLNYPLPR